MKKKSDSCFCGLLLSCFRWKRFRSSTVSDTVQPEVPQDRQNEGAVGKTDVPQPTCDYNVIFFAYSVCRDSWMFALHKEQQKNKLWTSIYILAFLFLISVAVFLPFDFKEDGFWKYVWNNWEFFVLQIILIIYIIYYYCRKFKHLNNWSKKYQSMVEDLDENKGVYLECTKNENNRMSSFINKYRYDNWMEQKEMVVKKKGQSKEPKDH